MSIDPRELRIGNLVSYGPHIVAIDSISTKGDGYCTTVPALNGYLSEYDAVPLTPELLLKCGFAHAKDNNSFQLDTDLGFSIWGRPDEGFWVYVDSDEIGNPIKYLHSLQNLYFALTGNELTINLSI